METQRDIADIETVIGGLPRTVVKQPFGLQGLGDGLGGGQCRIDQLQLRCFLLQQRLEQRIVGAAQHQRVHVFGQQRLQIFPRGQAGNFVIQPTLLHQRHKQWTGLRLHARGGIAAVDFARVGVAVYRGIGGNHADVVVARGDQRRLRPGTDYVQNRHIARHLPYFMPGHGRNGVTGDDKCLYVVFEHEADDLGGKGFDGRPRLHAVGHAGGVAEINDVFQRQAFHQGAHVGQAADAGIKNADGALVGCIHNNQPKEAV